MTATPEHEHLSGFEQNRMRLSNVFLMLGAPFPVLVTTVLLLMCVAFALHAPLHPAIFISAAAVAALVSVLFIRHLFRSKSIVLPVIMITFCAAFFAWSEATSMRHYDFSFDGQWYHEDAMILMKQGWNPFTHELTNDEYRDEEVLNHYAQGAWIVRTAWYSVTNRIESAKLFNFLLMWSAFCFAAAALIRMKSMSIPFAVCVAALGACNPVSVQFCLSYYVDGQVASCILMCISLFMLWVTGRDRWTLYLLACAFTYLVHLKFTAAAFAGILMAAGAVYLFFSERSAFKNYLVACVITVVVGVGFIGYPTYVQNTLVHQHPFFPLMGPGNMGKEISQVAYPADFFELNRIEKLGRSLSATPVWSRAPMQSVPKPWFGYIEPRYLDYYVNAGAEVSGLGPLFAECLQLTLLLSIAWLILCWRMKETWVTLTLASVLMATVLIVPECWYMRYVPQLYFVVLALVCGTRFMTDARILSPAWLLVAALALNTWLIADQYAAYQIKWSNVIREELHELKLRSEKASVAVYPGWMRSLIVRLDEAGIRYHLDYSMKYPEDCIRFTGNEAQAAYRKP